MKFRLSMLITLSIGLLLGAVLSIGWQVKANAAMQRQITQLVNTNSTSPGSSGVQVPQANTSTVNGTQPGNNANGTTLATFPNGQMSYQGRLFQNGSPYSGTINITFRLYTDPTAGTAFWTETQSVNVQSGLFNVMLGAVNPLTSLAVSFQFQVYLGIQPAGAASELTPRQALGTSAYAMGLIPGATTVDTNPAGVYGYSLWVSSVHHSGIYGEADDANNTGVVGNVSGNDSNGIAGYNSGGDTACNPPSHPCASAVSAKSTVDAYGVTVTTNHRTLLLATGTGTGYWDIFDNNTNGSTFGGIFTSGPLAVSGFATFSGGKSGYVVDIALNASSETLERGDVVVITGSDMPVVGEIPVAKVAKATPGTASGVMGVVDVLYKVCDKPATSLQAGEQCGGFDPSVTQILPGQYLAVVTLGAYGYLKADATGGAIKAGDLLTASSTDGLATKASMITAQGVSFYAPGTIIGKSLGDLDSDSGYIPVFVSIR